MNDEFLYELRVQPPATFAAKLKARLAVGAAVDASKRRVQRWILLAGMFLGATALAFMTPTIRTAFFDGSDAKTPSRLAVSEPMPGSRQEFRGNAARAEVPSARSIGTSNEAMTRDANPASADGAPMSPPESALAPTAARRAIVIAGEAGPGAIMERLIASFHQAHGYEVKAMLGAGVDSMCSRIGNVDVVATLGRMSEADTKSCAQRGIRFEQVPLAYEAYIAVVNRDNTWANALTSEQLRVIGGRRPYESLTTWNELQPNWPSLPISIHGLVRSPPDDSARFEPQRRVQGFPFVPIEDDAGVPRAIEAEYGSLGFMKFATYQVLAAETTKTRSGVPVRVVSIVNRRGDPVVPSETSIQDGSYDTLSRPLLLYFNVSQLHRQELSLFVTHAIDTASLRVGEYGLVPVDGVALDASARRITALRYGRR